MKLSHLSHKFIEIVKNPKYGHGKNMNPCIDCRILMLREAKEMMEITGADFIITGEVLGQRPMSQRRETLPLIDREAGLDGYVLRPLTSLNLKPTIPEQRGIVKRELLYGFKGRSRRPQMALAARFGLKNYPAPAGGCLLTDPIYSYRLRELLQHNPDPSIRDINLLKLGRHFRVSRHCKVIVGRNEKENIAMESLAEAGDYLLQVIGYGSPLAIVTGDITPSDLERAAQLCARYSDAKHMPEIIVSIMKVEQKNKVVKQRYRVCPADDHLINTLRIQPSERRREYNDPSEQVIK